MSNEITGIVQEIKTRKVAGGKTAYEIVVGGQAYSAGLYAPKCKQGDYVKFVLDDSRGYKNVERNTLQVSKNKPANYVEPPAVTSPKAATSSFDARQDAISRQAASNTAIAYLAFLQSTGTLPVATSKSKGAQVEALEAVLKKYTEHFYEQNTGVAWKDIAPTKNAAADDEDAGEEDAGPADDHWE